MTIIGLDSDTSMFKVKYEALLFLIYFPVIGIFLIVSWVIWRKRYVALTQGKKQIFMKIIFILLLFFFFC